MDLLSQFLAQECTQHVRELLEGAVRDGALEEPSFELNRFSVRVLRGSNEVVLEDLLDSTEAGVQRLALDRFVAAVRAGPAAPGSE